MSLVLKIALALPKPCHPRVIKRLISCSLHGDALTEVDVKIHFFDFVAVDGGGLFYVLTELVVHNLGC